MDGITELIPFLIREGDDHMWMDFLKSCAELRVFVKKSNEIVPVVNSLLNEAATRCYGLKLLDVLLKQCPKLIINDHIVQWFHQCIKSVQNKDNFSSSFTVLISLLEASKDFPNVRKQVATSFIAKIVESLTDKIKSNQSTQEVMKCLYTVLSLYGKSCGSYKDNIQQILINLLNSDPITLYYSAKCFHLLSQTGASGSDLVSYKENWLSQHLMVVNSLHGVLNEFYSDVNEITGSYSEVLSETRTLDLPVVDDEYPVVRSHKLSRQYCGLVEFLDKMLLDHFPTSKKICPEAILGLIFRTLAVTCKSLQNNVNNSTYSVMTHLSKVHTSAIKLFNSLILSLGTNLLPFSNLISKVFIQIFKSTDIEGWANGCKKPFSNVRSCGYKCLLTWLTFCKSCSLDEVQIYIIIDSVIKDIKCDKKIISLNVDKKTKKNKKMNSVTEINDKVELNEDTCIAALDCIPVILRTPLNYVSVKKLQETVVKLMFKIQRMLRCNEDLPAPYSDGTCRANLYSSLLSLCVTTHPQFPPPLHYANILFSSASTDPDIYVQRICSNAISSISHLLRPSAPSFDFQVDLDSEIIPINAYPSDEEVEPRKQGEPNIISPGTSKSDFLISNVHSIVNDEVVKDELIDLDDSSSDSLIIVESQKDKSSPNKSRDKKENSDNEKNNKSHSFKNLPKSVGEKTSDLNSLIDALKDNNDNSGNIYAENLNAVKINGNIILTESSQNMSKDVKILDTCNNVGQSSNNSPIRPKKLDCTEEIEIIDDSKLSTNSNINNEVSIIESPLRRSKRIETNDEVTITDDETQLSKRNVSKLDRVGNISPTSSLRRARRNIKSDSVTIIEDEPVAKKSRVDHDIEILDDDEMMMSFVDSVVK